MRIKGIKVTQPLGEFYIAKIKAGDLLRISKSAELRYNKNGKLEGNQRKLNPKRLRDIAKFIMSEEMTFPSSILIAANYNHESGEIIKEEVDRWKVEPYDKGTDLYDIVIPDDKISSIIIDGQHRLKAFEYAHEDCKNIELVCSIFMDLPNPYQAYLFATINCNQKRVDKSLSLELFGYDVEDKPKNTWSPEKLAVYLTRKFNFSKDSSLYQRIKLAPLYSQIEDRVDASKWLISTAAMVDGILSLITTNAQRDRDVLARSKTFWGSGQTRDNLRQFGNKPVLREKYLDNKDDEIYSIIDKFFTSVKTILWNNAPQNSIILKTIGISVLFDVLKTILENNGIQESYDSYVNLIAEVNYTHNYFSLSGIGKTRLKRILKYKIGLLPETELTQEEIKVLNE